MEIERRVVLYDRRDGEHLYFALGDGQVEIQDNYCHANRHSPIFYELIDCEIGDKISYMETQGVVVSIDGSPILSMDEVEEFRLQRAAVAKAYIDDAFEKLAERLNGMETMHERLYTMIAERAESDTLIADMNALRVEVQELTQRIDDMTRGANIVLSASRVMPISIDVLGVSVKASAPPAVDTGAAEREENLRVQAELRERQEARRVAILDRARAIRRAALDAEQDVPSMTIAIAQATQELDNAPVTAAKKTRKSSGTVATAAAPTSTSAVPSVKAAGSRSTGTRGTIVPINTSPTAEELALLRKHRNSVTTYDNRRKKAEAVLATPVQFARFVGVSKKLGHKGNVYTGQAAHDAAREEMKRITTECFWFYNVARKAGTNPIHGFPYYSAS